MSNRPLTADFNPAREAPADAAVKAFFAAAQSGDSETLRDMLELHPVLVEWKDTSTKATALIIAAKNGNDEAVKVLLDGGADINASDAGMMNAICSAAYYGHFAACDALVAAGADPAAPGPYGASAIACAHAGDFPSLGLRLEAKAAEKIAGLRAAWNNVAPICDGSPQPVPVMKRLSLKPKP